MVSGVASYGNCFGVPNLGGETKFEPCYSGNPLVNAFAMGLVRKDEIFYARAAGEGNPVIYVGAKTGRDGIHGATMASEEFSEASEAKRPNVQVGDPFLEKLLLEACLEAMQTGAIVLVFRTWARRDLPVRPARWAGAAAWASRLNSIACRNAKPA